MLQIGIELCCLTILSAADWKTKRVSIGLLALCCVGMVVFPIGKLFHDSAGLAECLRALAPGLLLLLISLATRQAGYADGILLLALGVACREGIMMIFLYSLILMALTAIGLLIMKRADRRTALPYIPFVLLGWILWRMTGGLVWI